MIPKIIHFCWFGGNPLPPLALECIASWRKYLPDYEIWQWSEGPFNDNVNDNENSVADRVMGFDVNVIPYTEEAYKQKKYAFVSDYCRFYAIYKYGGIYFDTDVEVIRPMNDIIAKGNFMGFEVDPDGENTPGKYAPRYCFDVALGLGFGMEKEHPFMKKLMDYYEDLKFEIPTKDIAWYKTIVAYTTEMLCEEGLKNIRGIQEIEIRGERREESLTTNQTTLTTQKALTTQKSTITIYPREYFAPIDVITGRMRMTENTYTIHRYMGSWNQHSKDLKYYIRKIIPDWVFYLNNRIKRRRYRV